MKPTPEAFLQTILQVQAGRLSATAAAQRLGISRKTYHAWEYRGLSGMLEALRPGRPGRPRTAPDRETVRLRQELERMKAEQTLLEQRLKIREVLGAADSHPRKSRGEKTGDRHDLGTA